MSSTRELIDIAVSVLDSLADTDLPATTALDGTTDEHDADLLGGEWHSFGASPDDGAGDVWRVPPAAEVVGGWQRWQHSELGAVVVVSTAGLGIVSVGVRGRNVVASCLSAEDPDLAGAGPPPLSEVQPLLAAIDRHLRRMVSSSPPEEPDEPEAQPVPTGLTTRETEALFLLAQGHTAAAAARRMGCSTSMVHRHLGNVYRKLGVNGRLEAVLEAQRRSLLPRHDDPRSGATSSRVVYGSARARDGDRHPVVLRVLSQNRLEPSGPARSARGA